MNKKLTIYDYQGTPVEIEIKDFEEVILAYCEVISGDEILTIIYKNGSKATFDAYPFGRAHGYKDGKVEIPLDKIDEISDISDSYEMLEHFGDINAKLRVGLEAIGDLAELARKGEL